MRASETPTGAAAVIETIASAAVTKRRFIKAPDRQ
jgi:hypothetical protein